MIAQRFTKAEDTSDIDGQNVDRHVHFHLHVSPQIASALMQLVTAFTGQRSLFTEMRPEINPTWDGGRSPASETPAAAPQTASQSPAEALQPCSADTTPEPDRESLLDLLLNAPYTLRQKRQKAGADQRGKHETSCRAFDKFMSAQCHRFSKPVALVPLFERDVKLEKPVIRDLFCEWWLNQTSPRTQKPVSEQTIATYWQHVCMVMRAYGVSLPQITADELKLMRDGGHNANSGARVVVKRICPAKEEIDALARHSNAATRCYGAHAPYLIRFLVRWFSCWGLRTNDVISTRSRKTGLRKQDIIWTPECPDENVNAALGYTLMNPGGWVWIRIHKSEKKHAALTLLPIPDWARGPLKFFCELSQHDVRVFPSMKLNGKSLSPKTLAADWDAVAAAAGVDSSLRMSEGSGDAVAIRKYSSNWWRINVANATSDTALSKDVSAYVLHHASITKTTAARSYEIVRSTVLPIMVKLLPTFPRPAADVSPVSMLPE